MPVYVFRVKYLIKADSRPIIVEAESVDEAEEAAVTIMAEQGAANLVDPSSFSTQYHEVEDIHTC